MSQIDFDTKEEQMIFAWAEENRKTDGLTKRMKGTMFFPCDCTDDFLEYKVENFPDLKNEMERIWGQDPVMQKIIRVCGVAALKAKPQPQIGDVSNNAGNQSKDDMEIPAFVYVF